MEIDKKSNDSVPCSTQWLAVFAKHWIEKWLRVSLQGETNCGRRSVIQIYASKKSKKALLKEVHQGKCLKTKQKRWSMRETSKRKQKQKQIC